jgi:hypothetical protein
MTLIVIPPEENPLSNAIFPDPPPYGVGVNVAVGVSVLVGVKVGVNVGVSVIVGVEGIIDSRNLPLSQEAIVRLTKNIAMYKRFITYLSISCLFN